MRPRRLVHALEAGHHGDLRRPAKPVRMPVPSMAAIRAEPWASEVMDRDLPALPGAGLEAHFLQHDGEEAGGHLLAGGDDHVVFPRVVEAGRLLAPADELVGLARHGGDDDGHVVAGLDLAFDVPRHVADALDRGDGCAAELHDQTGHGAFGLQQKARAVSARTDPPARRRVYRIAKPGQATPSRARPAVRFSDRRELFN